MPAEPADTWSPDLAGGDRADDPLRQGWLDSGRAVLAAEAAAISSAELRLGTGFAHAVQLLLNQSGKVVVTGIGKSGHIARKIAATFSSTGTPAIFLHAAEASHGDLGIYAPGDPTIMVSKSGSTPELCTLLPILRQLRSPAIGILGRTDTALATQLATVLDASVSREADEHNLAPTASTAVALALGDALAMTLMRARRFGPEEFARFHPGGQLGRRLNFSVGDVMHPPARVARVGLDAGMKEVVIAMTRCPLGAAVVLDHAGRLAGLITDGDVRRALERWDDIRSLSAADVMTVHPVTIHAHATLHEAAARMEERPSQISVLPVIDGEGFCCGLVRLHDLYQPGTQLRTG